MSVTLFEGKLVSTDRWSEAEKTFNKTVFEAFLDIMSKIEPGDVELILDKNRKVIWISPKNTFWLSIDEDGVIEIGEPAA
jgi:hypothetical protein